MITTKNANKKAIHTKTRNIGFVIDEYNRTNDGKRMVTVKTLSGQKAYWDARKVEIREW